MSIRVFSSPAAALFILVIFPAVILPTAAYSAPIITYAQTNLVSDIPGMALSTDPALINPWGLASSGSSPFWVANNGSDTATLYNTAGMKQALTVTVPREPTGQVFNGNAGVFNGDAFLFATVQGTIEGWRGSLGTVAETLVITPGASYTGLAIGTVGSGTYLYAANFAQSKIDVYPSAGAPALMGTFTDPTLPSGYAPFNIQQLNGVLYVMYAKVDPATGDEQHGAGLGFVDTYNLNGTFLARVVSQGSLNAPWGVALAPADFGPASGALLVGNFGDGTINAFNPSTGTLIGTLADGSGNPLVNSGLWALKFGNGGSGGNPNSLYITAGINDEMDGLFAQIDAVPEPATIGVVALALAVLWRLRRSRELACSGR